MKHLNFKNLLVLALLVEVAKMPLPDQAAGQVMRAQAFDSGTAIISGIVGVIAFFILLSIFKAFIKVTYPDKILVVTGRKKIKNGKAFGFSIDRGRTTIIPFFQSVDRLDLRILPVNVQVDGVNSANGITVGADATACVCIDDDDEAMLYSAVERLMGKSYDEIKDQVQKTLIGNFRGALNRATPLEAIGMVDYDEEKTTELQKPAEEGERAQFRKEMIEDINSDISAFGMRVVSVSLQNIWDSSNYIANLSKEKLSKKREEVEIEEARLKSLAEKVESDARREIDLAKSKAKEAVLNIREDLEIYRRESEASIEQAKNEAKSKISERYNKGQAEIETLRRDLQELKNQTELLIKENADKEARTIVAKGEERSSEIIENAKNSILEQKIKLMESNKGIGNLVLFVQQQLPYLYEAFKKNAAQAKVKSLLIMDKEEGFKSAVNRGPESFGYFLQQLEKSMGISLKEIMSVQPQKN
ncbi:MAG: SPFH domain-containing protein [Cyclobacteriaceae bacterium]